MKLKSKRIIISYFYRPLFNTEKSIMVNFQIVTPMEYKKNYKNLKIHHAFHQTPFGKCLIGVTDISNVINGNKKEEIYILHLAFTPENEDDDTGENSLQNLKIHWPHSILIHDRDGKMTEKIIDHIFSRKHRFTSDDINDINVLLKGTPFEIQVWKSLTSIPPGTTTTYGEVAKMIDKPKAVRAVGNALAKNQIACLIPCHRVMAKSGANNYGWGPQRKLDILEFERSICFN